MNISFDTSLYIDNTILAFRCQYRKVLDMFYNFNERFNERKY